MGAGGSTFPDRSCLAERTERRANLPQSVYWELITELCSGAKHHNNRVGAIHAYALCLCQKNFVSAIKCSSFYCRHICFLSVFSCICVVLVTVIYRYV